MSERYSVYTLLHARTPEVCVGTLGTCDEGISAFSFSTHIEDYTAYFSAGLLQSAHPVLFDGYMLPHGMPAGGQSLDYEYGRHTDKYRQFAVKRITWQEERSTVRPLASDDGSYVDPIERSAGDHAHQVRASLKRQLLLIPKGSVAFGFRLKPRTLERQYVMIEVQADGVIFRTT